MSLRGKGVGEDAWGYEVLEELFSDTEDGLAQQLLDRQTYWIKEKDSVEHGLKSSFCDGMKGMKHSQKSRELISKNHQHYQSEETKEKLFKIFKGRSVSPETRAKISAKTRGKKRTAEQRQAQSDRLKGKVPQAATDGAKEWVKRNGGGYWKNHTLPATARANMKAAQQQRGTPVLATFPDGHQESFPTMLDAATETGHLVGSVF